jgi:small subunit ribosomal protein S20
LLDKEVPFYYYTATLEVLIMPEHESCYKRMRQNEYRRKLNKSYRSYVSRTLKDFRALEDPSERKERLSHLFSVLDKAVRKGIFHSRKSARLKSRLSRNLD